MKSTHAHVSRDTFPVQPAFALQSTVPQPRPAPPHRLCFAMALSTHAVICTATPRIANMHFLFNRASMPQACLQHCLQRLCMSILGVVAAQPCPHIFCTWFHERNGPLWHVETSHNIIHSPAPRVQAHCAAVKRAIMLAGLSSITSTDIHMPRNSSAISRRQKPSVTAHRSATSYH